MDANLQVIKSLYQQEIEAYKRQLDELRIENKSCNEKNSALLDKVRSLNELIDQAHVANKDLHTAFEHIREENYKLKANAGTIDNNAIRTANDELALETCQRQYIELARESVSWISEKDKLNQRLRFLERECERYTRDNVTLGKQVRHLLKALEEERGMIIRRSEQVTEYGQPVNASDVIDTHLVTFESIEQLQGQNQKLLSLVKELSKKEEEREMQMENEDIRRLNSDLETMKQQLDAVKGDRERIMSAFNMILKERDLFKILLCKTRQVEHLTPEIFQRMVSIACQSGPAIAGPPDTQDKDAHIVDLKAMITKLENELMELRKESEKVQRKLESELEVKTELLDQAHIKIVSESQQAEVLKERNQLLETNMKALMEEFDEARTKLQKTTFELEQEKQKCKDLTEYKQILVDLKFMITKLENESIELRKVSEKAQGKLEDELRAKTELLDQAHIKIMSESQQAQVLKEQYEILEANMKAIMEEFDEARAKLQKTTSELEQEKHRCKDLSEHKQILSDNYLELRTDFFEVQRLRNLERSKHLELSRSYFKLKMTRDSGKSSSIPETAPINVEEARKEEKRDASPVRKIILKRRKIV